MKDGERMEVALSNENHGWVTRHGESVDPFVRGCVERELDSLDAGADALAIELGPELLDRVRCAAARHGMTVEALVAQSVDVDRQKNA